MTTPLPEAATMTRRQAAAYVGLCRHTFDREVAAGNIPAPLPLGSRKKLWSRTMLDRWLDGPDARPRSVGEALDRAVDAFSP